MAGRYIYIYIDAVCPSTRPPTPQTHPNTTKTTNTKTQVVEPEALLGASIDYLGDLDGDGKAELIIGAPGMHELRGEAYIVSLDKDAKCVGFWGFCGWVWFWVLGLGGGGGGGLTYLLMLILIYHHRFFQNLPTIDRVKHLKALVEDDHELHDLIAENDEFGWCVYLLLNYCALIR